MIYLQLFWSFFQIGLFSFGGGYVALPLIQEQVVNIRGWLTMQEFADVVTISQMTPGPISINAASFVGAKMGGILGSVIATLGNVFPPFVIVITLAFIYYRYKSLKVMQGILYGLRPAVVGLIASAGLTMLIHALYSTTGTLSWFAVALFVIGFVIIRIKKINPIIIIGVSGVVAVAMGLLGVPL
ncbi:MAG: chromate transporter [Sphaerochaetaceae bacterium]|jgi:chromate transporter|nr:chromate transporter [Sphaerochaetaceae bacterium]